VVIFQRFGRHSCIHQAPDADASGGQSPFSILDAGNVIEFSGLHLRG